MSQRRDSHNFGFFDKTQLVAESIQTLSDVYNNLQQLTQQHKIIDDTLKNLPTTDSTSNFNNIEEASSCMISICKKLKNQLAPKDQKHCCCHS